MTYLFPVLVAIVAALATAAMLWPLRKPSRHIYIGAIIVVPLLVLGLYRVVGTSAALDPAALQPVDAEMPASLDEAIAGLRAELDRNPAQPDGWVLLGRSYAMMDRFAEARDSYAEALKFVPDDAGLLVEAAQARAQADPDSRFDDEALAMLRKAAAIEPGNQRAPWFIGIAHRQRGEDAQAASAWEALLPKVDDATALALRQQIDAAREAAGLPPMPAAAAAPTGEAPVDAAPTEGLRVRVALDPDFASRVRLRGDATVFVIARVPGGPPMPIAVERHTLQDLPLDIVLDDSDGPMPTQKLSALPEVEVFARISASGDAARQDGDLESAAVRVALPAPAPVELVIGR